MKLKKIGLILWLIFSVAIVAFLIASQFWPSQASFWQEIKGNQDPASNPAENQLLPNNSQIAGNGQPINFLLLGAPGAGNDAPDLTDTIIIAHLDPSQQKIYLFSLPRDLLVKMPGADYYVKINSLYAYNRNNIGHEFDALRQSAEDLTGLPIDHYIFIDLTVLKNTIDTLGGINVMVEKDIIDTRFPGPNHSYQTFALKAGWRYLDGETALKYARSRHSGAGDFDRIERQQEILQAIKRKALGLHFWNFGTYWELYNNFANHVKTDLGLWQLKNYYASVKEIPGENLIKSDLESSGLFATGPMNLGGEIASIVKPRAGVGEYKEIKEYIKNIIKN